MDELEKVAREYQRAKAALDAVRPRLAAAIVAAARSGVRQSEIVKTTGYTRERVRQICREAGVEPGEEPKINGHNPGTKQSVPRRDLV